MDKTAVNGVQYLYTVRCLDSSNRYISMYDSAGLTITYFAAPALSTISNINGGVKISWSKSTGASSYRVYRKKPGESWARIGDTTSTSYTDKTAVSGTKYVYTVRSMDSKGALISSFDPSGKTTIYLGTPTLGSVTSDSNGVKITWSKVSGAAKYRVYRKKEGGSWAKLEDTTSTSYVDRTANGIKYYYTVRSMDSTGTYLSSYDPNGIQAQEDIIITSGLTYKRGQNATISIKGEPNVTYSIKVTYKSGVSTAEGLYPKKADANGNVSWTWKIGSNTSLGTYPVEISGNGKTIIKYFTVID